MNNSAVAIGDKLALRGYFGVVDYVILVGVLLGSLIVGLTTGLRKTTGTREFLTGGRDMNPIAVCLSLLGGVISAISVQGNSTEMYLYGSQLWMNILGCLWGTFVVMFFTLPVLYPLNLVSMCQYLELRFDSPLLKKLGSLVQIVNSIMYLGVCLYAPSLTLSSAIGIPMSMSLLVFGSICGIYITLGGVRAVIYTDVVQTVMMFVGVIAVVTQVLIDLGGFSRVWEIAEKGGRLEFFNLDTNPLVRHTFWSVQVLGMYFVTSVVGISQPQFQRLSSVRSLRISQGLCVAFFIGLTILWSSFYFSGLVAYAAYADCDPIESGKIEKPDQIMAYMVGDKLSHLTGMVGLFVAAVAGALLSSLSSQANAMVVLIWEDFLSSWWIFAKMTQETATRMTKFLSAGMVLLAIGSALLVAQLGTLFQAAYSISGAIIGPFDGLFITAIGAPWVNAKGAISGFSVAVAFNLWLIIGKFYYGAGKGDKLPLSTAGCPMEEVLLRSPYNVSHFEGTLSLGIPTTTALPFNEMLEMKPSNDYLPIYDLSYCYLGTVGIIIVLVVSSIVSFITGPTKPSDVDLRLVNLRCFRIYCKLYGHKADSTELLSIKAQPQDFEGPKTLGDPENQWQGADDNVVRDGKIIASGFVDCTEGAETREKSDDLQR
ncbi:sodium-coupled monocarboxylate transporter 1-like [Macrobrachium nipponense]|uniref:sodium-coupled monocarboxylate transporter 1-like n=1 Tax=Macrobrachium nipponense TaxID=159736 RepID=UPI0030C7D1BB